MLDTNPPNQPVNSSPAGPNKETLVKIDHIIKSPAITRGKDARSSPARILQSPDNIAVSDDVKLTATAEKMSQLSDELQSLDINDHAKIESIRQEIAEGRFKVDEEAVAESLVQESITSISRRAARADD
jgi:negative regulator of flagellin synthesis FlgM